MLLAALGMGVSAAVGSLGAHPLMLLLASGLGAVA
jgi:hypothetical protein